MKQVLCFGDSNTWGYNPRNGSRFPWGIRWTSRLQNRFDDIRIIEEGLCGRTTIFEDPLRNGRNGTALLPTLLETHDNPEAVVIMLGTNDCKTVFNASAEVIGKGISRLIAQVRSVSPDSKVLIVSPIYLGDRVWEEGFDREFSKESIGVSHELEKEYEKIARKNSVYFLRAADYAKTSHEDEEHMDEKGHEALALAVEKKLLEMGI